MDTVLFLGGKESTTLKSLTESLGKETVYMLTNNISRGQSPSYSQNTQKLGKELMSVDELAVMDGMKCILQLRGVRPFLSDKFDITKHKNYRFLSDFDDKHTFDIGKFVNRKLKVKPDEEYDFHEYPEYVQPDEDLPEGAFDDFEVDLEPV
jgi:type IV secretion system protein VirD4